MSKGEKAALDRAKVFLGNIINGCISEKEEARKALAAIEVAEGGGDPVDPAKTPSKGSKLDVEAGLKDEAAVPKVTATKKGGKK